jgi:hypothetical protein
LIPMAEQWGNIGRVERSAISDILPDSQVREGQA